MGRAQNKVTVRKEVNGVGDHEGAVALDSIGFGRIDRPSCRRTDPCIRPDDTSRPGGDAGLVAPLFVTHAGDGSGRLFIVEQAGRVRILRGGALVATPVPRHRSAACSPAASAGCSGLAFHPQFATNGRFFVNYTRAGGRGHGDRGVPRLGRTRTWRQRAETRAADDAAAASPTTTAACSPSAPTATCTSALGDGGGGGRPGEQRAEPRELLGKILRIDVDRAAAALRDPARQPVRRRRRPAPRSGRSASATRGASPSTGDRRALRRRRRPGRARGDRHADRQRAATTAGGSTEGSAAPAPPTGCNRRH